MKKKVFLQPKLKKKNIKNERDYKWMSIHSFIMSKWEFFALCKATANSFLKVTWQACKVGCTFLKMNCLLNDIITSVQLLKAGIMRPMEFQNWIAMGHRRKRCSDVSSICCVQRTHSLLWSSIPLRLSKSRVLSLSFKRSQKKTLCLCWQRFCQSHLKGGGAKACPVSCLYALAQEKKRRTPNISPCVMLIIQIQTIQCIT